MNKGLIKISTMIFAVMINACLLTGCGDPAREDEAREPEYYKEEDYYAEEADIEYYEEEREALALNEKEREDFALNDKEREALAVSEEEADSANAGSLSYDEIVELAMDHSGAPLAELDQVMENGNLYIHLYEDMGDHTATIDWYEIDPKTLKGTNFLGDPVDLTENDAEGDAGEGMEIADGEYVTDDEYEGELSEDGKVMTITTALYEFVNSPSPSYPRQIYVINVADSCRCVQTGEGSKETSFFESMDLIRDFLEGKSGLPITLVFKNNELIEIQFSS